MAKGGTGYIAGIVVRMGAEATDLGRGIDDATKSATKLEKELKVVEQAMKLDPKNSDLAKQKLDILTDAANQTRVKLDALKEAHKKAEEAMRRGDMPDDEFRALTREITFTEAKLKDLERELKGTSWKDFGEKAEKAGEKLKNIGSKMQSAGSTLNRNVTLPLVAIGVAAAKSAADMEALDSQFEQTFGTEADRATKILEDFSGEFDMLPNRMKPALIQMTAFAKTAKMDTPEALDMASRALRVAADSSAFYDKSLEETTESLQSFLKGKEVAPRCREAA